MRTDVAHRTRRPGTLRWVVLADSLLETQQFDPEIGATFPTQERLVVEFERHQRDGPESQWSPHRQRQVTSPGHHLAANVREMRDAHVASDPQRGRGRFQKTLQLFELAY